MAKRAHSIQQTLGSDFAPAFGLAQLQDAMERASASGEGMTDQDKVAYSNAVFRLAGLGQKDLEQAGTALETAIASKDGAAYNAAINPLIDQAAKNWGMASSASLREQLIPYLSQIPVRDKQ